MKNLGRVLVGSAIIAVVIVYIIVWRMGSGTVDGVNRNADAAKASLFIVFVDVTSSLDGDELQSVGDHASQMVATVAEGSRILVIPILRDVERAKPLLDETFGVSTTSREMADFQARRRTRAEQLRRDVAALVPAVNADNDRARSCISGALRRAAEVIAGSGGKSRVEIVLISDMVEECDNSIEGHPVSLAKAHIIEDIDRAKHLPRAKLIDLRGSAVTAVIPTARNPRAALHTLRPPVNELAAYWREILDRCGDAPSRFAIGADLPARVLNGG